MAAPGKETRFLTAESREGPEVRVPVATVQGAKDGPTLLVVAGVHGSEYVGIEATRQLFARTDPQSLSGRLVTVPCFGLPAFYGLAAHVSPIDGVNPGNAFPGSADGTHTERAAHLVWTELFPGADAVIDVHGGDLEEELVEYAQINLTGNQAADEAGEALARALGLPLFVKVPQRPQPTEGDSLFRIAPWHGTPGVLAEAGSHGELDLTLVDVYRSAFENGMRHLGMLEGDASAPEPQLLHRFAGIFAPVDGFWAPAVKKGETLEQGQVVGEMYDLFGEHLATVEAEEAGVILGVITTPARTAGSTLVGLGTFAE